MKNVKRFLSLILVSIMVLTMSLPVFAAEITVKSNSDAHTYQIYQLLTGKFETVNSEKLIKDASFGTGVTDEFKNQYNNDAYELLKKIDDEKLDGDGVLKLLGTLGAVYDTATAAQGETSYVFSNIPTGYYLIKDTDHSLDEENDAYTKYILLVVDEAEEPVDVKSDVPKVEKKVKENSTGEFNDVADYDIGDVIEFKLSTKMVTNYDMYEKYYLAFHDTMSEGLSFTYPLEITVTVDGVGISTGFTHPISGQNLDVVFDDTKAVPAIKAGSTIEVIFKAFLNEKAKIGVEGNPNKVTLEFSNNPNDEGHGKTPEDEVIVFTYELPGDKYDGADNAKKLAGAEFVLKKGQDGPYYQQDTNTKKVTWVANKDDATKLISDANGKFGAEGLDQGTYYLEETKAPEGYNLLTEDITVVVSASRPNGGAIYNNDNILTPIEINLTQNTQKTDVVSIANNKGVELPETGGMGTTIFYIIGALLALGAGVVLVTRRRMQK